MATPNMAGSLGLYKAAQELSSKGRFARAAEKHGGAAAAAAQELKAEDCLVVAYLRAAQAETLICHSWAPTLTVAERDEARQTVTSVLLPQCVSTLTRRKAAGTLLPGSCRAAEVAWVRATVERKLLAQGGLPAEVSSALAEASAPLLGLEAYWLAAGVILDMLFVMKPHSISREMQLSHAAFVAAAFELMAQPRELPCVKWVVGVIVNNSVNNAKLPSQAEQILAQKARRTFQNVYIRTYLDGEALSLMADAWRRVECSGGIAMRMLDIKSDRANSVIGGLETAAAEAAVRGLRDCAMASCAATEVHVSQFKRCSACQQAFYCCREHQVEDWPAHKAACKAARKAAAPKDNA